MIFVPLFLLGLTGLTLGVRDVAASAPPSVASSYNAFGYANFPGLGQQGTQPPDLQIAAGVYYDSTSGQSQVYVVEFANQFSNGQWAGQGAIYTTTGTIVSTFALSTIFNTGGNNIFDPKIIYDTSSLRWFASVSECQGIPAPTSAPCTANTIGCTVLAMSDYRDPRVVPTNHWHSYTVCSGGQLQDDQPLLGISKDKVIVSSNVINKTSNTYLGAFWTVYNLNDMETSPNTMPHYNDFGPYNNGESLHPVHDLTYDSSGQAYMVSTFGRDTLTAPGPGWTIQNCDAQAGVTLVAVYLITGVPPNAVSTSWMVHLNDLGFSNSLHSPPSAHQAGGANFDTGDCRTQDAVFWNNKVWLAAGDSCTPQGDSSVRSCVQLIKLDVTIRPEGLLQDFELQTAGTDLFYPALRVDGSGSLNVVLGASSPTSYPTVAITGQGSTDNNDALAPIKYSNVGQGPSTNFRYGDYFGAGSDPNDPKLVWIVGEFYTSTGTWASVVASMKICLGSTAC